MATKPWNRRQMVQSWAQVAAGVALGGFTRSASAMQLPPPEPLQDDRLTFVTTTEASPWQKGATFKPAFGWDFLNLNVDPERITQECKSAQIIEGFGGCFHSHREFFRSAVRARRSFFFAVQWSPLANVSSATKKMTCSAPGAR